MMPLPRFVFGVCVLLIIGGTLGCSREGEAPAEPSRSEEIADSLGKSTVAARREPRPPNRSPIHFLSRTSCSAAACHGHASFEPKGWQNAYHLWESTDPHRRAFEVLYAERSMQMYRRLEQIESPQLDDAKYLRFLEQKCIGCHATPPTASVAGADWMHQSDSRAYWQGVSCESCHGPASDWLDAHYAKSWPAHDHSARANETSATGFQDTKSLATRSTLCLQCHLGPQNVGQQVYDVNHDLIAAGHPRLTFELHAYLDNLPKHWDERDAAHKTVSHFETWREGQVQRLKQEELLAAARDKADFANVACLDCHRPIGEPTRRRMVDTPKSLTMNDLASVNSQSTATERARLITKLMTPRPNGDEALQLLLATSAFARDLPAGTLSIELEALQRALTTQAGKTQYDLPAQFDPQDSELQRALRDLETALQQLPP